MKIALVTFGNEESYGLLFVAAELLGLGQELRFFDSEAADIGQKISDWAPEFVFFSPMTTFFPKALGICRELKAVLPETTMVFGGHHVMSCPAISGLDGVDTVVVGPATGTLEKILAGAKGVIQGELTSPQDLPLPARREYYRDISRMAKRYRKIMLSTLGCPWNCTYCCSAAGHVRNIFGAAAHRRYYLSRRPLSKIIEEARVLLDYETQEIEWVDDDILWGPDSDEWIPAFAATWEKEIGLPMYVSTTSMSIIKASDAVLSSLRRIVNCVGMGIQSIRPESLKLFNRTWDSEARMKEAYDRLASFGFSVNLQCIVGLPVDDPVEEALETIEGMKRIGTGSICSCYPLMIYPGTAIEAYCRENGYAMNPECKGDTNAGIPGIAFPEKQLKQLRNICKLATLFVKYGISRDWMGVLVDIDFDDATSKALSTVRYYECVKDRLKDKGELIFNEIMGDTKLRY